MFPDGALWYQGVREPGATFFALTPDRVLDAVEVGGLRCTGRCLPLRAFENRVYEVELDDERRLVVKFYRPGRCPARRSWTSTRSWRT